MSYLVSGRSFVERHGAITVFHFPTPPRAGGRALSAIKREWPGRLYEPIVETLSPPLINCAGAAADGHNGLSASYQHRRSMMSRFHIRAVE